MQKIASHVGDLALIASHDIFQRRKELLHIFSYFSIEIDYPFLAFFVLSQTVCDLKSQPAFLANRYLEIKMKSLIFITFALQAVAVSVSAFVSLNSSRSITSRTFSGTEICILQRNKRAKSQEEDLELTRSVIMKHIGSMEDDFIVDDDDDEEGVVVVERASDTSLEASSDASTGKKTIKDKLKDKGRKIKNKLKSKIQKI